ncbi:hypothetical protein GCM10010171_57080 [Actinokineospora fastidiosa]|uniref:Uncharacterized protein n=1 Tax=Actinokineospora fastidiosa TaxID=1816 RepID=A0A918GQP8_9PSEU|nr:hypothetical protein GCM10010171_57080 [Actinokineospora fastidiosa]
MCYRQFPASEVDYRGRTPDITIRTVAGPSVRHRPALSSTTTCNADTAAARAGGVEIAEEARRFTVADGSIEIPSPVRYIIAS